MTVALVTAAVAQELDWDLPPLVAALEARGVPHEVVHWHDPDVAWDRFALIVVRSVWDYTRRHDAFVAWCHRAQRAAPLLNTAEILVWSSDKRYLLDLARAGVPTVETSLAAPGEAMAWPDADEIIVKPAVSAGSLDVARHARADLDAAEAHVARLHAAGRTALAQPYLAAIEEARAETELIFIDRRFTHAVRKAPMLTGGRAAVGDLYLEEDITPARPTASELRVAEAALAAVPGRPEDLLYARVDLVPGGNGPVVMELELLEPSLHFPQGPGAERELAGAIARRLSGRATGPA